MVPTVREFFDRVRILVEFPFRVDPFRCASSIALLVLSQLAAVGSALALGLITNAVIKDEPSRAIAGSALLVATVVITQAGSWASFVLRSALRERTALVADRELTELMAAPVGIEHMERPEYLDRVEYLRQNREQLTAVPLHVAVVVAVILRLGVTLVVLLAIEPVLLALPLFVLPVAVASTVRNRRVARTWARVMPLWREQGILRRFVGTSAGAQEIRVFGMQDEIRRRYWQLMERANKEICRTALYWSAIEAGCWVVFGAAFTTALVIIGHQAVDGTLSAGAVVVVITLATQVSTTMGALAFSVSSVGGSTQAAEKLQWLRTYSQDQEDLRPPGLRGAGKDHHPLPTHLSEGIRLENVSFGYPGTGRDVLRDISLLLPAGAIVAIVGENGAGKSTLVKLLLRLYPTSEGRVLVDGRDLETVDPDEWRRRTSAGFQDFARFEFTLQHAVGVGSLEDLDHGQAVFAALGRAGGTDIVDVLPDGLSTQLGRKVSEGVELSGGQWQKVALGRSMMRAAPVLLVLDEPTAALDALSEAALFERYTLAARSTRRRSGGITVLVSHRYSTVRTADLIVVLREGAVAETGTHAQLITAGGPYAELYRMQAAAYE